MANKYIISTSSGWDYETKSMYEANKKLIKHSNNRPGTQMAIFMLVKTRTGRRKKKK